MMKELVVGISVYVTRPQLSVTVDVVNVVTDIGDFSTDVVMSGIEFARHVGVRQGSTITKFRT